MRATALTILLAFAHGALAAAPRVDMFPAPAGHLPTELARQGDAVVFVSWTNWPALEPHIGRIGKNGKVAVRPLAKDHLPAFMSAGPDGSLWLSDGKKKVLWRVRPNGKAEQIPIGRTTLGITVGNDGTIWSTHPESAEVTRYSSDGSVQAAAFTGKRRTERVAPPSGAPPAPKPTSGSLPPPPKKKDVLPPTREERKARMITHTPAWITAGSDNTAWFSDPKSRTIGRVDVNGQFTRYPLPREWGTPGRIVRGADGAYWFLVTRAAVLGRIAADGTLTSVDIPAPAKAIAADARERIWFSDGRNIGYVDKAGAVHQVALPEAERIILTMAEGPDGAMWFVDQKAKALGRVTLR
jgi:virginiamycin B lyase